ncbi:hypothetical protein [Mariniflexile sp.]|uniref:hypothetical protein n=2 Tax=Mariniflexile sp. TaxID=1979402 RepID=UPI0040476E64
MKTKFLIATMLLVFVMCFVQAQTPQDMAKIRRIQDSMMNLPQMKEMMQQIEESNSKQEAEEKKRSPEEKKTLQKNTDQDDWYWKNFMETTTVSKNNKLPNWEGGPADISLQYRDDRKPNYLKIETILADGNIIFNFPKEVETSLSFKKIPAFYTPFFDIREMSSLQFTNADVGFTSRTSLAIIRDGQRLGNLTIGNSVRVTKNLLYDGLLDSGDEGYLLYWAYAAADFSLNADENWEGNVQKEGTNTIQVKTNVNYNLNFKKGWNLVKAEVIGNYKLNHERGYEITWFKNHKHTIISSMPNDAIYYFRTVPQY